MIKSYLNIENRFLYILDSKADLFCLNKAIDTELKPLKTCSKKLVIIFFCRKETYQIPLFLHSMISQESSPISQLSFTKHPFDLCILHSTLLNRLNKPNIFIQLFHKAVFTENDGVLVK